MNETASKELSEARWRKLRNLVRERGILRVEELAAELGVSAATIRRDLAALELSGNLRRIHGGAVAAEGREEEPLFDDKTAIAAKEKQSIAEAALKLVRPRDIVYLDGGSTILALARLLTSHTQLTAVTNSLRVAQVFSGGGPRMILTGGECRLLSQTFVGTLTRAVLEKMHVDTAFLGTIGVSAEHGMTTTDPAEAFTKEIAMERASRRVLLADSSKFGKTSFVRFGEIRRINTLISDKRMPAAQRKSFRRMGVELILV
ncbi:MAG: DeoR/GlpR family DNA-binding transcription regulator [Kiritimatiellae bacterium]|mgnify:FL=1|nr:DeoR/GlpR family DNA-binding transcription regulator [Kiritimatiellia bacterium]MDD3545519.1 DeoR/GlpR family DNA-binding transcription regulator [Kiritimatiellia bacterium]MDD4024973.1 DeoR/GlpR family DNA-binding transcription regulator [Kiritimatiellia bacterium]